MLRFLKIRVQIQNPSRKINYFSPNFSFFEKSLSFPETGSGSALFKYQSQQNPSRGIFTLQEKPINLHGNLHLGHIYNKLLKDIILRYKLLSGFKIKYQPGFTCFEHEFEVEAMREIIEMNKTQGFFKDYQPEEIRKICSQHFLKQIKTYQQAISKLNLMIDFSESWFTLSQKYQAKIMEIFGDYFMRDFIYRGHSIELYSFSRRKAIVNDEDIIEEESKVPGAIIKMEVADFGLEDNLKKRGKPVYFLVTIREFWELTGVQALGINPNIDYVILNHNDLTESLIMSRGFFEKNKKLFEKLGYAPIFEIYGRNLLRMSIKVRNSLLKGHMSIPLIPNDPIKGYGTDVFTIAPAHNFADFELATIVKIERKCFIDRNGKFTEDAPDWLNRLEILSQVAEKLIIDSLKKEKAIFQGEGVEVPQKKYFFKLNKEERLLPISMEKWLIKNEALKEKETTIVNISDKKKEGMVKRFLNQVREFQISEKGVWGIPIPVFYQKSNKNAFISPEILSHLQDSFNQYGVEIWFKWKIKDLLPEKYRSIADTLIKGTEVFDSAWVNSCCSLINLKECTISSPRNTNQGYADKKIDLVVEGEDEMHEWVPFSIITTCKMSFFFQNK